MRYKILAIVAGVSAASIGSAQFVNGNFETGNLTGWTVTLTTGGANVVADAIQYDIDGPGALGTNFAGRFSTGRAVAGSVQEGLTLTQSMNLTAGTLYTFDFDWSAFRNAGVGANTEGGVFSFIVNGTAIATQAAGSTSGAAPKFGHITATFTPTATQAYSVGAMITRPFTIPSPTAPNLFQAVDNFTVTAVPEPASMAALGLGIAAILRRRRARK